MLYFMSGEGGRYGWVAGSVWEINISSLESAWRVEAWSSKGHRLGYSRYRIPVVQKTPRLVFAGC